MLLQSRTTGLPAAQRRPGARNATNLHVRQGDSLDLVVHRVGDQQVVSHMLRHIGGQRQDALRLIEHVRSSPAPTLGLEIRLDLHDLVVSRVGDDERAVRQES
jgi:hypothetical protein